MGGPEETHAMLPVDEPSGRLPNRVAILGVHTRTDTKSSLGPLSHRAPDIGDLWGTVNQTIYNTK